MSTTVQPGLLADLRPYHMPDSVGWWPPAPGWWLLLALVIAALAAAVGWWRRGRRRSAPVRQAERELDALWAAFERDGDAHVLARGCSRLLRRLAVARFGRRAVAGLTGEAWLAFLDERGGGGTFRQGSGRSLLEAPYRPVAAPDAEALCRSVRDWLRSQRASTARGIDAPC
jgi:hypothetical protein